MIGTTSSTFESFRPAEGGHDLSWYGTLGMLVACVGLLIAAGLAG